MSTQANIAHEGTLAALRQKHNNTMSDMGEQVRACVPLLHPQMLMVLGVEKAITKTNVHVSD